MFKSIAGYTEVYTKEKNIQTERQSTTGENYGMINKFEGFDRNNKPVYTDEIYAPNLMGA